MACLELLGQSMLERAVETLQHDGVKLITVVVRDEFSHLAQISVAARARVSPVPPSIDLWSAAECILREYVEQGVELILLSRLGAYIELDLAHLIRFHRDKRRGVTVVTKDDDPLDHWVITADEVREARRSGLQMLADHDLPPGVAAYPAQGYVCRLEEAPDLRRLLADAFLSRSAIRPRGREVRPGIWLGDGARVHRSARLAAPVYVGYGAQLCADTLVSEFCNVERGCYVHEGTIIEDASVLANTWVGKGLNVAHAIVDGNKLLPLRHNSIVEIRDSKLLGRTPGTEPSRSNTGGNSAVSLAERLLATAWN
ncbi:MAG: hypothetical protein WAL32_06940 [Terriglobales bacterium]